MTTTTMTCRLSPRQRAAQPWRVHARKVLSPEGTQHGDDHPCHSHCRRGDNRDTGREPIDHTGSGGRPWRPITPVCTMPGLRFGRADSWRGRVTTTTGFDRVHIPIGVEPGRFWRFGTPPEPACRPGPEAGLSRVWPSLSSSGWAGKRAAKPLGCGGSTTRPEWSRAPSTALTTRVLRSITKQLSEHQDGAQRILPRCDRDGFRHFGRATGRCGCAGTQADATRHGQSCRGGHPLRHAISSVHELDRRVIDRHGPTGCGQNQIVVRP